VAVLGGFVGAIVGFAVGIFFTEIIYSSTQGWTDVVPFALAVLGILVGSALGRRLASRRSAPAGSP
jgi:ABC-type antimicrobial peptide transport system permease subunit